MFYLFPKCLDGFVEHRFMLFVRVFMAHLHFEEHVVDHALCPLHRLRQHLLGSGDEPIGLLLRNGGHVMSRRDHVCEDLPSVRIDELILLEDLLGVLDLQQGVLVFG